MKLALTAVSFLCMFSFGVWAVPPAPDDPLIVLVDPTEGLTGQHVHLFGYNFGSAPQVEFNGTVAPIVAYRPDLGELAVSVPAGATSGPLVVTNTDTATASDPADFEVLPGTYTSACTISGTVTQPGGAPLANVPVLAADTVLYKVVRVDVTDAAGQYSLELPSAGTYVVGFTAPAGTPYLESWGESPCTGVLHHEFTAGPELRGTIRTDAIPYDPIKNSRVQVADSFGGWFQTISDANGEFSIHVAPGPCDVYVRSPVGSRSISKRLTGVDVSSDTDIGDVNLTTGWLLSGRAKYQDSSGTAALMNSSLLLLEQGVPRGNAITIADGRFWLATPPCADCLLLLRPYPIGLLDLDVWPIDVPSDTELTHVLTVYSSEGHGATLPTILETGFPSLLEGQPTYFSGVNLGGSSVSVRFPDGAGGWVDGVDTWIDADRDLIGTRVPAGADSGNVHIRVDGVDGPGWPLTIEPGIHQPGGYTITGTVSDGSSPMEGVPVVLIHIDQCDDGTVIDHDVTDASGAYSVKHITGNHILYVFTPVGSGLPTELVYMENLTGDWPWNVVLEAGDGMTGRVVDSGIGPVGTSDPIPNSSILAQTDSLAESWVMSDASGAFAMDLVPGYYYVEVDSPLESRYLSVDLEVGSPGDLGDIQLDSGYFIEGYVVDETGAGVPGIEVFANDTSTAHDAGSARTRGDTGRFLMPVPTGTYDIRFWLPENLDYVVERVEGIDVSTDVLLYQEIEAQTAAHVQGTVYLADGVTPVPEISVDSQDPQTWNAVRSVRTCQDGSYDLRVVPGDYIMHAWPGLDYPCLAREFHGGSYYICDAEPVTVGLPDPTTGIDFTLDPAGNITGRVVDDSGAGIPDAWMCVDEGPGASTCWVYCAPTRGDGTYLLENVPVGGGNRVRMTHASLPEECWDGHTNCTGYDPVSVDYCTETQSINFGPSGTVPGPVPDGTFVPGLQMTASYESGTGMLTVHWQPTCDATGHSLYVGNLRDFESYASAECNIGTTGTFDVAAPAGDSFFLVVGNTWPYEGSYGRRSDGVERPSAEVQYCGFTHDLAYECTP